MVVMAVGIALFLGIHSTSIVGVRDPVVARIGEGPWKGLYSLVAAVGLGMMVWGYGLARMDPTVLWLPPRGLRHLVVLLMVPVFPLLFAAYLPGRIRTATKHPMLVATKPWAVSHLLANGMLADVLLFGGVLAWAVVDRISLKRRVPRAVPAAPAGPFNDVLAVVLGLGLYVAVLLWLHAWWIGVPPLG